MSIKDARKAKKMTQEELSKTVGISQKTISAYENGTRKPSVKVAKAIGQVLDIPWVALFEEVERDDATRDTAER